MNREHYQKWSREAAHSWVLSPDYTKFWAEAVQNRLDLHAGQSLCDLGAGNGSLANEIQRQCKGGIEITCVEPHVPPEPIERGIRSVPCDGVAFVKQLSTEAYNHVLMKQVLHHIPETNWKPIFEKISRALRASGKLLILTMPEDIEYPMFGAAKKVFRNGQVQHHRVLEVMQSAGFQTHAEPIDYQIHLSTEYFFNCIRGRFISELARFTDQEIEEGIQEIRQQEELQKESFLLTDRLWALVGMKVADVSE